MVLLLSSKACKTVSFTFPLQLFQGAEPVGAADGVRPVQRPLQPLPGAGMCLEGLQLERYEGGVGSGEEEDIIVKQSLRSGGVLKRSIQLLHPEATSN